MSFRSKRLRVRLPCGEPTVMDLEAVRREAGDPPCNWVYATPPPCHLLSRLDLPCDVQFGTPCPGSPLPPPCPAGFITPDVHCPHGTISLPGCPSTAMPEPEHCRSADSCQMWSGCLATEWILLPGDEGAIFVDPHALPALRRQLEERLRAIEVAELTKEHLEARLEEIGRAEEELRERDDEN